MSSNEVAAFQQRWGERIGKDALAKRVIAELWRTRDDHIRPVLDAARAQNPIIDPVIGSEPVEMAQHVADHFRALLALPSPAAGVRGRTAGPDPLGFVVRHAIRRAQAGVPLRAVLQAYRSGHRSFWAIMCEMIAGLSPAPDAGMRTTMLLSDYCIVYTDLISIVLTEAYVAEEASLTSDRAQRASAVVDALVSGQLPLHEDGRELCIRLGIAEGAVMVAVVARDAGVDDVMAPRRFRALANVLEQLLPGERFGCLVDARPDEIVAIIASKAEPGAEVARALRAEATRTLRPFLSSVRIGIGLDVREIAALSRSYSEAVVASELRGAHAPIRHLLEVDVNEYFRHTADPTARRLLSTLPAEVLTEPLRGTVSAFAASSLNVKECARLLDVHTNTIYYRLNRVRKLTGLDPRSFAALSQIMTALQAR